MTNPVLPGEFSVPPPGSPLFDAANGAATPTWYAFFRSLWLRTGGQYGPDNQVSIDILGKPPAGYFYLRSIPIGIYIPRNFEGTATFCATVPTANATFTISGQNVTGGGYAIGTIRLTAGSQFAHVGAGGAVRMQAGDVLLVQAPNPQDATLSDISINLLARKI